MGKKVVSVTSEERLEIMTEEIAERLADFPECESWEDSKELINALALRLISYATLEDQRRVRKKCQAEGIARAKAEGVKFGRSRMELPESFDEAQRAYHDGKLTLRGAAEFCGMAQSSFYKALQRADKECEQDERTRKTPTQRDQSAALS